QFFVGTPDAAGIKKVTWIGLTSVTHATNMGQRLSTLSFSQTSGGLNVTAPANANLAPPGYYMLFLVNGSGVPSVARFVRISRAAPPRTFAVNVNFQPAGAPVPAGYVADTGAVYGNRGNGYTYGWNADNSANSRDRNAANSPDQRYDTLNHMQKPSNPNAVWEIAVPNGSYRVRLVVGDPSNFDSVYRVNVEGTLAVSGTPSGGTLWFDNTVNVTVSDGRLTVSNGAGASNNKVCFIDITSNF